MAQSFGCKAYKAVRCKRPMGSFKWADKSPNTWTPKVCRIMASYRFWAIILPILGGSGMGYNYRYLTYNSILHHPNHCFHRTSVEVPTQRLHTAHGQNPALPIIRNIP